MTPLGRMIDRLARLPIAETQARALRAAAEQLQAAVMENLSHGADEPHAMPWLRTGGLRDSIGVSVDGDTAVVGSTSVAAAAQELGTATLPPRPFLAPAMLQGESVAKTVGSAFAALLRGEPQG